MTTLNNCNGPCETCRIHFMPGGCSHGKVDKYRYASPKWVGMCERARMRADTAAEATRAADAAVAAVERVAELAWVRLRAADTCVQLLVGLPLDKPPLA